MNSNSNSSDESSANYWLGLLGPLLDRGLLVENEERLVVYANDHFADLFGIPIKTQALTGMSCALLTVRSMVDFVEPEKYVADLQEMVQLRKEVRGHQLELKEGRKLLCHYTPILLPRGKPGHMWQFEEVTPKKKIKTRLIESELPFRHIVAAAQDGIICLNSQGRITEWNRQATRMFGWSKASMMGRFLTDFIIAPELREAHRRGLERFLKTCSSRSSRMELMAMRRDGSRVAVELSLSVCEKIEALRFIGYVRDVSAQKDSEKQIAQKAQFNSLLARIAQQLIKSASVEGAFSACLEEIQRFSPEIGLGFYEKMPGERCYVLKASRFPEGVAALPEKLPVQEFAELLPEFVRQWPLTERHPFAKTLTFEAEGDLLGHLILCGTEECVNWSAHQNQTMTALFTLGIKRMRNISVHRSLAAAIDKALEGIAIMDSQGIFTYMNPAHAHLFGYESPCELIGKSWRVLYRPEDVRKFETEVFPKLGRDGHWHDYPTGVKKDGTDIPEEVSLTLLPGGGLVCFCMDNSERLNALESLRTANASLQRSAKFKDQVVANMSHELRTPLNAVIGMTESLQLGIYGKLAAPQVRPTEVILSSARHLLALINDVLDLAKIEAGKLEVRKSRVDMKDLTESVLCMIRDSASAKSLRLHLQIPDNLPPLFTDERRLKQILVNLLDNAVKFTPNGRSVGLKVVRSTCPDQTLIDVWDEGIGIPLADQVRLFQPFVQLDTGYGRRFEGTGLGLSLVNRLTQMLGGVVRLQSEEGRGARFIIVLPDDLSAPQSADARAGEVAIVPVFPVSIRRDRNPLLLLVEDNQPNAEMLKAFVLAIGYRVTHVNSGEDALQEVDRERPEAILMDIQMPGMDGWETTRRLKSNPTTAEIPVIAVTALAMPEDRTRCAAAGVNAFFAKPLKLRELAEALQKWVPASTQDSL